MSPHKFNPERYTFTAEVAELMDCLAVIEPVYSDAEDDYFEITGFVYMVCDHGDLSVGIWPFYATPSFNSWEELEEFCEKNIEEYRRLGSLEILPETLFWERRKDDRK